MRSTRSQNAPNLSNAATLALLTAAPCFSLLIGVHTRNGINGVLGVKTSPVWNGQALALAVVPRYGHATKVNRGRSRNKGNGVRSAPLAATYPRVAHYKASVGVSRSELVRLGVWGFPPIPSEKISKVACTLFVATHSRYAAAGRRRIVGTSRITASGKKAGHVHLPGSILTLFDQLNERKQRMWAIIPTWIVYEMTLPGISKAIFHFFAGL